MMHHLLLIDEQQAQRESVARYLGHDLGYQVTAVASAFDAFEAALADEFDLAIISAGLPEVSGVEAFRRLGSIQPGLPVIFIAGEEQLSEQDRDFLRFSIPEECLISRPENGFGDLTRLIIGILGPPRPV